MRFKIPLKDMDLDIYDLVSVYEIAEFDCKSETQGIDGKVYTREDDDCFIFLDVCVFNEKNECVEKISFPYSISRIEFYNYVNKIPLKTTYSIEEVIRLTQDQIDEMKKGYNEAIFGGGFASSHREILQYFFKTSKVDSIFHKLHNYLTEKYIPECFSKGTSFIVDLSARVVTMI